MWVQCFFWPFKRKSGENEFFRVLSDELFYISGPERVPRKVIFEEGEKVKILESLHDEETGEHHGIESTFKKISSCIIGPRCMNK